MGFEKLNGNNNESKAVFAEVINTWGSKDTETFLKRRLNHLGTMPQNSLFVTYEKAIIIKLLDNASINPSEVFEELKLNNIDEDIDLSEFNEVCELVFNYVRDTENRNNLADVYSVEVVKNRLGHLSLSNIQSYKDNEIPLKVKRSSGDVEDGWVIKEINGEDTVMTKIDTEGSPLEKPVYVADLIALNSSEPIKQYWDRQPLNEETVKNYIKSGQPVNVRRSDGAVDGDWYIKEYVPHNGAVTVEKPGVGTKVLSLDEVSELNK